MAQTVASQESRAFLHEHFRPEAFGLLARQLQVWQRGCYVGWGAFVLAVLVIAGLAMRPALIPYPIVYDPDGRLIWHGQATTTREERFIEVRLVAWILACRQVTSDEPRFLQDREACGAMVQGEAAKKYLAANKEMVALYKDRQRRRFVLIDQHQMSLVPQGAHQLQITWEEIWTPEFGYGSETKRFQVTLTYAWYARPSHWTLDQARLNPSRVYVTDYWWDEIRSEGR